MQQPRPYLQQLELLSVLKVANDRLRYRADPLLYFTERLGIQREMMEWSLLPQYKRYKWDGTVDPFKVASLAVAHDEWVAIESATNTGKTFWLACLIFWFLENYPNGLVVTTAPKEQQLTLNVWKEISKLYPKFGRGQLQKLMLRMEEDNDAWLAVGNVAAVYAEEESATKAQGLHAEHLLIVLEEAPGIPLAALNALVATASAPHNVIVAVGNPDSTADALHTFSRIKRVKKIRISAYDHPNVVLDDSNFVPGAVSKQGIADLIDFYGGADVPLARSRTRGICPTQAATSAIKIEWLQAAADRQKRLDLSAVKGVPALGVDVANSENGDRACTAYGVGPHLLKLEAFPCPSSNRLGDQVYVMVKDNKIDEENVGVDSVGVGAGTWNQLNDVHNVSVQPLNGGPEETDNAVEQFASLRSQMIWQFREDVRLGVISLPDDAELFQDLVTPRWRIQRQKITIEPKDEVKKRLARSPNKGDAAVYWNWVRRARTVASVQTTDTPSSAGPGRRSITDPSPFSARRQRSF